MHPYSSLVDLKRRLGVNRRCFSFFHPAMPQDPLVFVHVAILPCIPSTMKEIDILSTNTSKHHLRTVAAFYSITNTQQGLRGIDLGGCLIKRVKALLEKNFNNLEEFVTLSPIPLFRQWIQAKLVELQCNSKLNINDTITVRESDKIRAALNCSLRDLPLELMKVMKEKHWYNDKKLNSCLKPVLMRLAAKYLLLEKSKKWPLDGVAKFHLSNGAEIYRLNYLADLSRRGMQNSFGIMVNYRYVAGDMEINSARYESDGFLNAQEDVIAWLKEENNDTYEW